MAEVPDPDRRRFLFGQLASAVPPPALSAIVDAHACLAFHGIACMSCRDACPSGAVHFSLVIGGARPKIDDQCCTGCGDCAKSCPADAIRLQAMEGAS